jgi:hypothetical protein
MARIARVAMPGRPHHINQRVTARAIYFQGRIDA